MKPKHILGIVILISLIAFAVWRNWDKIGYSSSNSKQPEISPSRTAVGAQLPIMLELGSKTCISCKKMKPILEELQNEYRGRVIILFIDVKEEPKAVQKYNISLIPTQIFINKDGKEVHRHVGFYEKEKIIKIFEEKFFDNKKVEK